MTHSDKAPNLALLALKTVDENTVYFIVDTFLDASDTEEARGNASYFYNEHSCPTNYIPIEAVFTHDDDDPHGVFDFIRVAPKPEGYDEPTADRDGMLRALFPETRAP